MEKNLCSFAEIDQLWLAAEEKEKEVAATKSAIEQTKCTKEKTKLYQQTVRLLKEQKQLYRQIGERLQFIKQTLPNHEKKTTTKI
ncbi:MAG: hypothetical protein AAF960_25570 [Bacteroidota bacterium]